MSSDEPSARKIISDMKGLDTSGVEVDDEQVAPSIATGSSEETAELAKMEALLQAAGDAGAIAADRETKLLCLRGRKYDPERAAGLVPKFLALKQSVGYNEPAGEQLVSDINSHKVMNTGAKDGDGRAVIWIRLRYHDPKVSKAEDMGRLIVNVMLNALKDPETQRLGVTLIQDMTGIKLKNLDPAAAKNMMGNIFPNLPIRVGRICIYNPPWILGNIVLPIVLTLMSKKLRGRIAVIKDATPAKIQQFVPVASIPVELEGTYAVDEAKWSEGLVATLPKAVSVS